MTQAPAHGDSWAPLSSWPKALNHQHSLSASQSSPDTQVTIFSRWDDNPYSRSGRRVCLCFLANRKAQFRESESTVSLIGKHRIPRQQIIRGIPRVGVAA